MADVLIAPSERVLIVGTSGSGKSYFVQHHLMPHCAIRPVIYDPKERWPVRKPAKVVRHVQPNLAYQIVRLREYDEQEGPDLWDIETQRVLRDAPHTLIIDETRLITRRTTLPPALGRVVRTGRDTKRGPVGVWFLTQEPTGIPTSIWSQSAHKFFFMVDNEDDLMWIGKRTNRVVAKHVSTLRKYEYVYYNRERRFCMIVRRNEEKG